MTKYKHKTEHSLFPVGLKGTPEKEYKCVFEKFVH